MNSTVKQYLLELKYRLSCLYEYLEKSGVLDLMYEKDSLSYIVSLVDYALLEVVAWDKDYLNNLIDEYRITIDIIKERFAKEGRGDFCV